MSSGLYEFLTTGIEVRTIAAVPLIRLTTLRLGRLQAFIKSAMEYALAAAALLLLAPVMAAIAALVKHGSKGPAIYRHRVLGVGGREFDAFKFRTMHVNGDEILAGNPDLKEELYSNGKLKQDPRVTRIGRYLRRYSLDELPQLLNVLRGEMSLVGPRFITPSEASRYGRQKTNLMTVKPGITGLWQVSGRSELSYAERARLDMHYIRNYSIWLDLQILFVQTPSAVIRARGAY
jgi:lipopolysaccharide/colanic/teichoic acid biosynthesis glycosyltransferase